MKPFLSLSTIMRQKGKGQHNSLGDIWGDFWCTAAADKIDKLQAALDKQLKTNVQISNKT